MVDVADSNARYYYHFDGLGSVVALSDVNNVVVESYSYDVFGAPTIYDANYTEISPSAIGNPYMFTARRADDETALYYYRARYYAFDIGRFLQTDPSGFDDGMNMYAYVGNSPVTFHDPSGLCKAESELQQSALGRAILGLSGFGVGFGEAVTGFLGGVKHTALHPWTLSPVYQAVHARETAAHVWGAGRQFFGDITSPDAERNGLAIGRLTGSIFSAGLAAEITAGITEGVAARIGGRAGPTLRPDVKLSGGRSGSNVKNLSGPTNSAVRGSSGRVYITNERGQVILDVTRARAKPVTPGRGFGSKRPPTAHELEIIRHLNGGS